MPRRLAIVVLLLVLVLYINAFVTHAMLRLVVQTAPLWPAVVLGFRRSQWCKWVALPCLVCWTLLAGLDAFFLVHPFEESSVFLTPIGIATTAAVGLLAIVGTVLCLRIRTATRGAVAAAVAVGMFVLQVVALRVGLLPSILEL